MSCPNFYKKNAKRYYVVLPWTTKLDDDDNEVEATKDSWDYDDDICFAKESAKAEFGYEPWNEKKYGSNYVRSMGDIPVLMDKETWLAFGKKSSTLAENNFMFSRQIFVRSGYYSGMTYDWDLYFTTNYGDTFRLSEYDSKEDMLEHIVDSWVNQVGDGWYEGWNMGMAKIQSKNLRKWLSKQMDKFFDEMEDVCRYVCEEEYVCEGIFSNGEAVYVKADSLRGKLAEGA